MRADSEATERHFFEVVDWAAYQYADHRKKPDPPWRWFRVQLALLRSAEWLALSPVQRADFIAMLGAASETGNLIPDDANWLRVRGLMRRNVASLVRKSLVTRISLPSDHPRIKQLRRALSGGPPAPEAEAEAEAESEGNPSSNGGGIGDGSTASVVVAEPKKSPSEIPSAPPREPQDEILQRVGALGEKLRAPNARRKTNGAHDPREFDVIKGHVREIARKFNTRDVETIHRLGGQSAHITRRQVEAAIKQLIEDREL